MPEPILLADRDGLRLTHKGQVRGYDFTHHHNPDLICQVICERRRRAMIREINERIIELPIAA